jgi:hypothetical protein
VKYTVRFAHLEKAPSWKVGDTIKIGDVVGKMGTSGQSTARHLHIDCVEGHQVGRYQLKDIEADSPKAAPRQMNWFIDDDIFKQPIVITTHYADAEYQRTMKKVHFGYDVVPENRHDPKADLLIYWNRSISGTVLRVDYDSAGYGNCLYVGFEA